MPLPHRPRRGSVRIGADPRLPQLLEAVLEVSTAVLAGDPVTVVRQRITVLAADLVHAPRACLVGPHDTGLWVLATVGDGPAPGYLDVAGGPALAALGGTDPVHDLDDDVFADPSLWVRLRAGEEVVAALGVSRQRPFAREDATLLDGFAAQASLALTHEQAQAELQRLSLLEDRERIGRDLHDTVIQRLFATGLSLQAAVPSLEDRPELVARLEAAVDAIDETVKEIRSTILALSASAGSGRGVREQMLGVVDEIAPVLEVRPRVRFEGPVDTVIAPQVAGHIGPVVREALTNVAKHANAGDVEVELSVDHGSVRLRVSDDGRGPPTLVGAPDAAQVHGGTGLGLANLRERAGAPGGELVLSRGHDERGTVLLWRVPS